MMINPIPQKSEKDSKKEILDRIKVELKRVREYTPKVGIFGDTGTGKSSLCNALFGKNIAEISDVEACTREPQEILLSGDIESGIVLVDVPGVGEDPVRHDEYIALYKSLLPKLDLVLWAIKSDDRKYLSAINVFNEVLKPNLEICPVIFVITQADKIEPHREWDIDTNKPSEKQLTNLQSKAADIATRFEVDENQIVAVSATDSYNLVELVNKIVEVLPNSKKFSFARETKEENLSDEAAAKAGRGILDHIAEFAGDVYAKVKDEVIAVVVVELTKIAANVASKLAKSISSWLK